MYSLDVEEDCRQEIEKRCKKDKALLDAIRKKIMRILENPHSAKPLKAPLEGKWRVHIGPFVLIYGINENDRVVRLLRFRHHDDVYGP